MSRLYVSRLNHFRLNNSLVKQQFSVRNKNKCLNDTFPYLNLTRRYISLKSIFPRQKSTPSTLNTKPILSQDDLFHPLSTSRFEDLRQRYKQICVFGSCPVCSSQESEIKNQPKYECPDCGFPTHCSLEHYLQDKEQHKDSETCSMLRQINEDEHDLRSGRRMIEFEFPSSQPLDEQVNMSNWDTFLYTRGFPSMDNNRSVRHVSKLLTYPITISSVLHEYGPYTTNNRLTNEGLKSLFALRSTLYPKITSHDIKVQKPTDVIRIFILGPRAESQLPPHIYSQLSYLFPSIYFHIYFIGPESLPGDLHNNDKSSPHVVKHTNYTPQLSFTWSKSYYHNYHTSLAPFDPYTDVFFLFSPGISQINSWHESLLKLLQTKCAIFITGFDQNDLHSEVSAIEEKGEQGEYEYDWLLRPGENVFRSMKRDIDLKDVRVGVWTNWGIFGIRGKKYDVILEDEEESSSDHDESLTRSNL
ncbi:9223_t:CDS:1 [Funneliformis caledonium]|uniref:9223_t:CDS:1 n=1 Tax=Funneliformis caledonium TaxID=1117310 RepID=A0A9N8VNU8_9GLOM|nr:9223_t:CDS:1 [Funneliformis caledonium]